MGLDGGTLATGEWECMECGYIEAGVETQRPEACPNCGAPGQALEFFSYEAEGDEVGWTADGLGDPDDIYEDSTGDVDLEGD